MNQVSIFISYAHTDFVPFPGYTESRVGMILKSTKHELHCHSSRSLYKVLRDVEQLLKPSDPIHSTIDAAIAQCDMALVLLSDEYCKSEECEREVEALRNLGKPIFIAELEDVWSGSVPHRLTEHRQDLQKVLSVRFWDMIDQRPVRFGWPLPQLDTANAEPYRQALDLLVTGIKSKAAELLGEKGDADIKQILDGPRPTVFVAYPSNDVRPEMQRLTSSLEAEGHSVFSFDLRFKSSLDDLIGHCDLFVQLLGGLPGEPLSLDSQLPVVPAQYQAAVRAGKPIFTWRADFKVDQCRADYAAFLGGVLSQNSTFEEFEQYLKKKAKEILLQRRAEQERIVLQKAQPGGRPVPLVVIDVAEPDTLLAKKIADALGKHVNITGTLPFKLKRSDLNKAIAVNDALILGFGPSMEGQKRAQTHFPLIQRRNGDLQTKKFDLAVAVAAPNAVFPRGPDVHVITVRDEVDEAAIFEFLGRLGVSTGKSIETH